MRAISSAKSQRMANIVTAARNLMRDTGDAGFSMRALADAAGVSIATPYNLFGSKQAIMYALLDDDLASFSQSLNQIKTDEIDSFFKSVSLTTDLYATEPAYHRAVLLAIYSDGGKDYRSIFFEPRYVFLRNLVKGAINAGYLIEELDADAFALNISHTFFACNIEWAHKQLSLPELAQRVNYGMALALSAVATEKCRIDLQQRVLHSQKQLQNIWRKTLKEALKAGPLDPKIEELLADQLKHLK